MGGTHRARREPYRFRARFERLIISLAIALALIPLSPAPVSAGSVIRVDVATGSDSTGNGTLARPYRSITKAVTMASAGDVVRVAPGFYGVPTGEVFPVDVPVGVRVSGMGRNTETIIAGDGTDPVFRIEDGDSSTVIEGLTIEGGGGTFGSGIVIIDGTAPGYGPIVQRNVIRTNSTATFGGGIMAVQSSSPEFKPTIRYNFFLANVAEADGGAIYQAGGEIDLLLNVFDGNVADDGAAVYAYQCEGGRIARCQFGNNYTQTGYSGGAIALDSCDGVAINRCAFAYNRAGNGGALYSVDSSGVTVSASILFDNEAQMGGAALVQNGSVSFDGCTVAYNGATGTTDGILSGPVATVSITNSILEHFGGDDLNGPTATYCWVGEGVYPGVGNITGSNPQLVGSGPFTSLGTDSPCIDSGDPAVTSGVDFDGLSRYRDGDGNGVKRTDMGAYEFGAPVGRVAGSDRYDTSADLASGRFVASDEAILVTGQNFPDALCASGLAGLFRAPILLTSPDSLPSSVATRLRLNQTRQVFIIGGTASVSEGVAGQLRAMGIDVTRLAGDDRYDTCAAVADYMRNRGHGSRCFVARGDTFPDALALGPAAYAMSGAVFLVKPNEIPATIKTAMETHGYLGASVAGGPTSISPAVVGELRTIFGSGYVRQLYGPDRYATASEIASWAILSGIVSPVYFGVATGEKYPDALAGGAVCAYQNGSLILTRTGRLPDAPRSLLDYWGVRVRRVDAFGGQTSVSEDVLADIREVLPP